MAAARNAEATLAHRRQYLDPHSRVGFRGGLIVNPPLGQDAWSSLGSQGNPHRHPAATKKVRGKPPFEEAPRPSTAPMPTARDQAIDELRARFADPANLSSARHFFKTEGPRRWTGGDNPEEPTRAAGSDHASPAGMPPPLERRPVDVLKGKTKRNPRGGIGFGVTGPGAQRTPASRGHFLSSGSAPLFLSGNMSALSRSSLSR
mmetsp:Transcript_35571/g.80229  ORF Transcript_35571/g.80229 Transcript_35571/m.80229 type:complete len:204 (-) Transcript_35571:68-679(-)